MEQVLRGLYGFCLDVEVHFSAVDVEFTVIFRCKIGTADCNFAYSMKKYPENVEIA